MKGEFSQKLDSKMHVAGRGNVSNRQLVHSSSVFKYIQYIYKTTTINSHQRNKSPINQNEHKSRSTRGALNKVIKSDEGPPGVERNTLLPPR